MPSPLDQKLQNVVGGRTAGVFSRAFGIVTVGDLLAHYPRRYTRRGELTAIAALPDGEDVTIVAEIRSATVRRMKARKGDILDVVITDGVGRLNLTFFNQAWRADKLRPGLRGMFSGKVSTFNHVKQLAHPTYLLFDAEEAAAAGLDPESAAKEWAEQPIPVYPATATLTSWAIQQTVELALGSLGPVEGVEGVGAGAGDDVLADPLAGLGTGLMGFREALEKIHRPQVQDDWVAARESLRFQEALVLQVALAQQRAERRAQAGVARPAVPGGALERFDAGTSFTLTGDQRAVGAEIMAELADTAPMNRLIQGEVGSGKTLVALRAMLQVIDGGGQAALLAPTEVLAAQHLRSVAAMLGPDLSAQLMPTVLTGGLTAAERRRALLRVVSGQARIVVGTHALMSERVEFFDLGLIVVDEQHRFGVDQREALRQKGEAPHVLVLTATPIPRTVAMTVFGDLDVSTIRQLPAGRQGIETFVVPVADRPGWMARVWERVAEEVAKGRQVFVVCPAIEPAVVGAASGTGLLPEEATEPGADGLPAARPDGLGVATAPLATVSGTLAELQAHPLLAGMRIQALHGRMSSEEKDRVMTGFAAGEIDVLVATTVIEVGVDVPNASMMVVLDADRFGISQLHQLRGRVGRGSVPGLALLVTGAAADSIARQRVEAVASTLDGFALAQADLELRHEGDVLGSSQSGFRSSLKLLSVIDDVDTIVTAAQMARRIVAADPSLAEHPALRAAIARRLDESARDFLVKG